MLCFASCATIRPEGPTEPSITWIHLRPEMVALANPVLVAHGYPPLEAGELLSYAEFRKLATWVVEERSFVHELEER
jgi:hypothetical protein